MDMLTNAFFYCIYQKNVVPLHVKNIFRSITMKHLLSIVLIAMVCIGCEPINIESGKNDGRYFFSVSDYEKVVFSPGNLQYHIGQKEWRFAENQTDYLIVPLLIRPILLQDGLIHFTGVELIVSMV